MARDEGEAETSIKSHTLIPGRWQLDMLVIYIIFNRYTCFSRNPCFLNNINLGLLACALQSLNKENVSSGTVQTYMPLIGMPWGILSLRLSNAQASRYIMFDVI